MTTYNAALDKSVQKMDAMIAAAVYTEELAATMHSGPRAGSPAMTFHNAALNQAAKAPTSENGNSAS